MTLIIAGGILMFPSFAEFSFLNAEKVFTTYRLQFLRDLQ